MKWICIQGPFEKYFASDTRDFYLWRREEHTGWKTTGPVFNPIALIKKYGEIHKCQHIDYEGSWLFLLLTMGVSKDDLSDPGQ